MTTVSNSRFIDNYGKSGSAINSAGGVVNIKNGLFVNSNPVYWSLIYGRGNSQITIQDSVFANTTSKYATAVYNDYLTIINRSKFINLKADATAGAIAIKTQEPKFIGILTITDSEFINVSASKNGGAIFADINSGAEDSKVIGLVTIYNATFNNCSSEFGGAVLQLGGDLYVKNSKFTGNFATNNGNGGAIYTSNATVNITKSIFTDNTVQIDNGLGGALYLDFGSFFIDDSTFTNNSAKSGGAIYGFDSYYVIKNSKFNNTGEDIHTYFDEKNCLIENCGDYNATVNDRDFNITIRYNGEPIILNKQKINGSASDSYFNLRDLGLVTPVKNQGSMGACWAFGAAGAFESAFLIATNITLDISENNIQDLGLRYSIYGDPTDTESGTSITSASYFLSWLGAIDVKDDEYDELGKISAVSYSPYAYRTVEALYVDLKDKAAVKNVLTTYGALNLFVYGADSEDKLYYNDKTHAVYYYGNESGNHYVTLVGWDDNFSKDNFVKPAPGDGAWICKNSW
jgi:predicted outer membrane repeat protein